MFRRYRQWSATRHTTGHTTYLQNSEVTRKQKDRSVAWTVGAATFRCSTKGILKTCGVLWNYINNVCEMLCQHVIAPGLEHYVQAVSADSRDIQWVKHSENISRTKKKYISELKHDIWAKSNTHPISVRSVVSKRILKYMIRSPDRIFKNIFHYAQKLHLSFYLMLNCFQARRSFCTGRRIYVSLSKKHRKQ